MTRSKIVAALEANEFELGRLLTLMIDNISWSSIPKHKFLILAEKSSNIKKMLDDISGLLNDYEK